MPLLIALLAASSLKWGKLQVGGLPALVLGVALAVAIVVMAWVGTLHL